MVKSTYEGTLHGVLGRLDLELAADGVVAVLVEGTLQRVALPAEYIVAVLRVARLVACAPDERLRAVLGPEVLVVEVLGLVSSSALDAKQQEANQSLETYLPHDFVHQLLVSRLVTVEAGPSVGETNLRQFHRMARGAAPAGLEGSPIGVGYVRLMVGTVDVLAVPARREGNRGPYATGTEALGQGLGVSARAGRAAAAAESRHAVLVDWRLAAVA